MPNGWVVDDGDGEIIIKSGSCELYFDDSTFQKDERDPRKRRNTNLKIVRVVIKGEIDFDSDYHPDGLDCEIRAIVKHAG